MVVLDFSLNLHIGTYTPCKNNHQRVGKLICQKKEPF